MSEGHGTEPGTGMLIGVMLLLVLVGAPLVYVLWSGVNDLLLGDPERIRLSVFLPALVLFAVLVWAVSRLVRRWEIRG